MLGRCRTSLRWWPSPGRGRSGAAPLYRQPKSMCLPPRREWGATQADSSCMDKPKYSQQPACMGNLGQLQPNRWPNVQPKTLTPLQGEAGMRGTAGRRGSLPSRPCQPRDAPLVGSLSLRGPARGASFALLHLCFCSFANYALTHALLGERGGEAEKPGPEHAACFIW